MIFHAARQLNLVNKAYELVDEVSVFHRQPLYAFSTLTMRTALFLVGMAVISYVAESIIETSSTEEAINLALSAIVIVPLSLVVVLLPLWGIHQRLQEAKENVLEENSMQTAKLRQQFYNVMDAQNYDALPVVESAMESLYKERDQLRGIPTWPWAAGAFRNFLSAVLLPMLLWFLQVVLSRFLRVSWATNGFPSNYVSLGIKIVFLVRDEYSGYVFCSVVICWAAEMNRWIWLLRLSKTRGADVLRCC